MKAIKFNYLAVTNFICFGDKQEFFFDQLSRIVSLQGENKDVKNLSSEKEVKSSNGSGKSTIPEALIFAIFGKFLKGFKKGLNAVHNLAPESAWAEVELIVNDEYRILRRINKKTGSGSVKLWKSKDHIWNKDTEITECGKKDTEKYIREELIGLTYEAFLNIVVFTDNQAGCFLECDPEDKRSIIEALLSLEVYRDRHARATELAKIANNEIKQLQREYVALQHNLENCKATYNATIAKDTQWKANLKLEIGNLIKEAKTKREQMEATDTGVALLAYQEAQAKIPILNKEIDEVSQQQESQKSKVETNKVLADKKRTYFQELLQKVRGFKDRITSNSEEAIKLKTHIEDLKSNKHGTKCNHCFGVVDFSNIQPLIDSDTEKLSVINKLMKEYAEESTKITEEAKLIKAEVDSFDNQRKADETEIQNAENKLRKLRGDLTLSLSVREPKVDVNQRLLEQEIATLKEEGKKKNEQLQSGLTPFTDLIQSEKVRLGDAEKNLSEKETEIKSIEEKIPYYEYWKVGFGDNGIRQSIVEKIIPLLNQQIAYWLEPLVSSTITLTFDNNLEETITRNPPDGDPYVYSGMSAGQRRRLNLAVSLAFADIMTISNGTNPSLIFLDEVTTNIDPLGVHGIYNMILALSKDKQVFVTTHDQDLLSMLESADTINLIHECGKTTIQKK